MPVKAYRKKPVEIRAIHWTGSNTKDVLDFCSKAKTVRVFVEIKGLEIPTLEGIMRANPNDYIIEGVHGEFYPCKPDIFLLTYEEVEDEVS